jgi:hypothetical protein
MSGKRNVRSDRDDAGSCRAAIGHIVSRAVLLLSGVGALVPEPGGASRRLKGETRDRWNAKLAERAVVAGATGFPDEAG